MAVQNCKYSAATALDETMIITTNRHARSVKKTFDAVQGDAMSVYNYVATAQKPTAVRFSLKGNFTRSDDVDLIVVKRNYIEVYRVDGDSLSLQLEFDLYTLIESIEICRLPDQPLDSLFVLTNDLSYCILSYNPNTQSVVTESSDSLKLEAARVVDQPKMAVLKEHELCIVNLYSGYLHAVPTRKSNYKTTAHDNGSSKTLPGTFSAKIDELAIISMVPISGVGRPTVAILYQDHQERKKVKLYRMQRPGAMITSPPELFKANAQPSDHMLVPVDASVGGLLVIGEFMITYFDLKGSTLGVSMRSSQITACCQLPGLTLRYLIGDQSGTLQVLTLAKTGPKVTDLRLDPVGEISAPTGLVPFGQQKLFVGSATGDSLFVKLENESPGVTVLDSMSSLAPITDFCFFDLDNQGRQKMVCCSGVDNDGSLRLVQNGVGFSEYTSLPIKGVLKTWALSCINNSRFHDTLVATTDYETRVFCMQSPGNEEEGMEEVDHFHGLKMDERTLALGVSVNNMLVQVTATGAHLIHLEDASTALTWRPRGGELITVAAVCGLQCFVSYGDGICAYLLASSDGFEHISETLFSDQVACADFVPVEDPSQIAATRIAVGLWGGDNIQYLQLPRMNVLYSDRLPSDVIPRSVMLVTLERYDYVFYALGDGHVIAYQIEDDKFLKPRHFTAGTHTPSLHTFNFNGTTSVFIASDNPAIIRSTRGNLIYSAVNMENVTSCIMYRSRSFQDNIIVSTDDSIRVGVVDYRQKLHFTKYSLNGEMGRKILYHEGSHTFAVATSKSRRDPDSGFEHVQGWLRIFDAHTFQVMSAKELLESEVIESMTSATIGGQELLLLGTVIMNEREPKQLEGRVIAYQVQPNRTYKYVDAVKVPGVVYSINPIGNFAVLSVNGTIYLLDSLKLEEEEGQRLGLVRKSLNQLMALCMHTKGEYLFVGDMIRSTSVYQLTITDEGEPDLTQLAADFHPFWMTATGIVQDDIYLGAESSYNILTFKRNVEDASTDRVSQLELAGGFYIGDLINILCEGSLASDISEHRVTQNSPYIFATANGSIGAIASISEDHFELLKNVETNLLRILPNIGNLSHRSWRMVKCDTETGAAQNFVDGDLVESFLRLRPTEKQMVVQGDNGGKSLECTVAQLQDLIESFSRLR